MRLKMTEFELSKRELRALVKSAQWVPFSKELRKIYTAFNVSGPAEFADVDGVYMVRADKLIHYVSYNGAFWGEYSPK